MTGRAQTIVCTAPARPKAEQRVAARKNRLPNKLEKQLNNATEPVLIGYARVSRVEGQDLAPQVTALAAAGCRRIHEERASGGRWDRPELTRLLGQLASGDVLVVWKLDRLSRSLKDLLLILERIGAAGAGFRSLTESIDTTLPAGRMMMQMLGAFAEYEREMVKERTQAGLKAARSKGAMAGGGRSSLRRSAQKSSACLPRVGRQPRSPDCSRCTARRSAGSPPRHVKRPELVCSCYVRKLGRKSTDRVIGPRRLALNVYRVYCGGGGFGQSSVLG